MIKWEIEILKKCYKVISSYKSYKYEFFKNILRFIIIDLQYYIRFRYTDYYNWESDILRSTLYCITKCSSEVDKVVHTQDSLRYNYWLTEPHKIESMDGYLSNIFHRRLLSSKDGHVKLLDLGSGIGLVFEMLRPYLNTGYEINDSLVEIGKKMGYDIRKKDILKLTKDDVKDFDIIFFYEPITNLKDRETFAKNLSEIVDNQVIIYNQGGGMINELKKYFDLDYIRNASGGGLFHLRPLRNL